MDGKWPSQAPREGSRHHLTVLFADLCDSTRLAEAIDAEVLAGVLNAWRDAAHRAVARHGGMVARVQGDGALAVFGYPQAGEQDVRRAADAALDLRAELESIAVPGMPGGAHALQLRAGIHSGLVYIEPGDIERGRFNLVGPTPHTAARLCAVAHEGEICASERALGPAMAFFDVGEAELHSLKGVAEPVRVRRIRGRATVQRRYDAGARRGLATFTGRDAVLQQIGGEWEASRSDGPRCVLLVGQPGVGKTRLIEEFAQSPALETALRLRGYCESYPIADPLQPSLQLYPIAEPLQPFLQLLRQALGEEPDAPAARLLAATGADAAAIANAQAWPKLIAAWLGQLAQQQPLLIVLDDWQWADDASRQTLDRILALPCPMLVLVASRSAVAAGLESRAPMTIELPPLASADSRELATYWLPRMDPFVLDEIHVYSGGIPLYVEELCHEVAAGGRLPQGGTAWLNTLIVSRMDRLTRPAAALLGTAAVLGNVFPAWLLLGLAGCAEDDSRLIALREQDFLFSADQPGLMRFKHGITRDAIYATVGLAEKRRLHGEVARLLYAAQNDDGESALEALAYHHSAAENRGPAAGFAERAGDKAMAANALDSARAQYTAALRDLDLLPVLSIEQTRRWCRIAQKLGMACVFDPISIPDRERLLRRAVELAQALEDGNVQARAEYWLGYALYAVGRARPGAAHCRRALELAQASGDEPLAAQVRATLGQALTALARYDEALPLLDDAIDSKRRRAGSGGGSTAIGSAYALACKGLLLTDTGRFAAADDCFAESRALLGASAHPVAGSVCGLMSISLLWQGRWDEAIEIGELGARVADRSRSRQLLAMGRASAGFGRWARGRDPAGMRAVQESIDWIETRGGNFMVSLLYGWLIEAASERGDETAARRHAARLLLRARDGDRIGEAMGCRALARLAHAQGRDAEALRWLERAEASARFRKAPHEEAHNLRCRALVDRTADAEELLAAAQRLHEELGLRAFETPAPAGA